ncbi:hypothetical protein THIOKS13210009 [Thiocapsa sp. KS1]|nr:hypothetical protein THIOKS13210009 [Thiocapsa sp. KS1]
MDSLSLVRKRGQGGVASEAWHTPRDVAGSQTHAPTKCLTVDVTLNVTIEEGASLTIK